MADVGERGGLCERCGQYDRVTFARDRIANIFMWLCAECGQRTSDRWSVPHLARLEREQAELLKSDLEERRTSVRVSSPPPDGGPILVVEDNDTLRDSLIDALEAEGFPTCYARNGRDALAMLRLLEPLPRVVLFDLLMPAMNGWEFYERLSLDRRTSSIPAVVITAQDVEMKGPVGSLAVIRKPLRLEQLLETVSAICNRHETSDPAGA